MRKIICYIFGLFLSMACHFSSPPLITVFIEGAEGGETVILELGQHRYSLKTDSLGYVWTAGKEVTEPLLGELTYGRYRLPLYVEPAKTFEVYLHVVGKEPGAEFSGVGALKNEILNGKYEPFWEESNFLLPGRDFIAGIEEWGREYHRVLDSLQLDAGFAESVRRKANCRILEFLERYVSVSNAETEEVREYSVRFVKQYEADFRECCPLLYRWVKSSVGRENGLKEEERLEKRLQWADTVFRNTVLKEYLIDRFMTEYIELGQGRDSYEELSRIYRERVQDKERREQFGVLVREWRKLETGRLLPDFRGVTVDSTDISLEDFTGKYVYLVIWSVDCKNSVRAVAGLKDLNFLFKKKNISFVGVCCGPDRAEWQEFIRERELEGIQLYLAPDVPFLKACKVTELPRFIFINPAGKIIEAYAGASWKNRTVEELKTGMGEND